MNLLVLFPNGTQPTPTPQVLYDNFFDTKEEHHTQLNFFVQDKFKAAFAQVRQAARTGGMGGAWWNRVASHIWTMYTSALSPIPLPLLAVHDALAHPSNCEPSCTVAVELRRGRSRLLPISEWIERLRH